MNKSKLYLLLESLSSKEITNLKEFLSVSAQGRDNELLPGLDYLLKAIAKGKPVDKEFLYSLFFPSNQYIDTKLRLAQSRLLKIIERFLQIYYLDIDESLSLAGEVFLVRFFRQRKLEKLYKAQNSKIENTFLKNNKWNNQLLQTKLDLEIETYLHKSAIKRRQQLNIQEILDTVDHIYYANKLKFACMAYAHQTVFKQEYDLENLNWILEDIRNKKLNNLPLIGSYYHAYHMIKEPNNDILFQYFDSFIKDNETALASEDLQTLYLFAINQCIRRLNNGDKRYGTIGLAFYDRALDKGALLFDGHLSRFTYRNIAMMAIRADDLVWAENFTLKYAEQLRKKDKVSAVQFNLALINYYKGAYPVALTHIQDADFKDHLINLAAKTLQAKIYYEMAADQSLYSLLDSVDIYLIRNKIIGYHRNNYRNIIKYFKKLSRVNLYDREKKEKLIGAILEEEILTERKWLLEKLGYKNS